MGSFDRISNTEDDNTNQRRRWRTTAPDNLYVELMFLVQEIALHIPNCQKLRLFIYLAFYLYKRVTINARINTF